MSLIRSDRAIDAVILVAVVVDVLLVLLTAADPTWWFAQLHGHRQPDPEAVTFLYRCAAHWTAFAVLQVFTLVRWRTWQPWLLVLAGVRWSDVLTDWTYLVTAPSLTQMGAAGLVAPGFMNAAMGGFLIWAWLQRTPS